MTPIKIGGKIFGAKLTATERAAMNLEIQKACAEYDRKNANEIDALVLYILMSEFDFSAKKLKKFHEIFGPGIYALCERYEMIDKDDAIWLCTHKLKEKGVDIEEWNKSISSTK